MLDYGKTHTVIFSTHIIEDIEHICTNLAILDYGKLLFCGSLDSAIVSGVSLEEFYVNITKEELSCKL